MKFADGPPKDGNFLVTSIWDRHMPGWRNIHSIHRPPSDPENDTALVKKLMAVTKAPSLQPKEVDFDVQNPDTFCIERSLSKRKGSRWQLSKNIKLSKEDE